MISSINLFIVLISSLLYFRANYE